MAESWGKMVDVRLQERQFRMRPLCGGGSVVWANSPVSAFFDFFDTWFPRYLGTDHDTFYFFDLFF
jgi:hypothetical protein